MAEGAMRAAAARAGLDIRVDSAGTADYHIGSAPDPRAIAAARAHDVDISGAKGRQFSRADFDDFTHIFALDDANLAGIKALAPQHTAANTALLLSALDRAGEPVPDPYYGDDAGFEECWNTVSEAADALTQRFLNEGAAARF